jgi:MoaA/NifB/PqqE/SkfB family radical SAM enzyme
MDARSIRHAIREAETLGVTEIYFTGREPFLHPEILPLLTDSLAVAQTSVLTNGTRIDVRMAAALTRLAREAAYSLDIRVSLDDVDEQRNDRFRGGGPRRNAVRVIQLLAARGILPIVTTTEILSGHEDSPGMYQQFLDFLLSLGIENARVKILPERTCRAEASSSPSDRPRSIIQPVLRAMRRACRAETNEL